MPPDTLRAIENTIEHVLHTYEQRGHQARALAEYEGILGTLDTLSPTSEVSRLRAYALMRAANVLTELERHREAAHQAAAALAAAHQSGDDIALGRAQMALAAAKLGSQQVAAGLDHLRHAATIFAEGESEEHRQGLAWVHILQAEVRALGLVESDPREVVERAEQALALLRPMTDWAGIDRAHAVRAGAWDSYGWAALWRTFEAEARLRPLPHSPATSEPQVVFLLRVPATPLHEPLAQLREALGPFSAMLAPIPDEALHIPLQRVGALAPATRDHLCANAARLLRAVAPLTLTIGNLNAFPDRLFLEVHDAEGRLAALRDRLRAAARLRPTPHREMIPHLPLALPTESGPAPAPLRGALLPFRRWPIAALDVTAVEFALLAPTPIPTPTILATLPLGQ